MKLNHLIIIGALCGALLLPSSASSWGVVGLSAGAGGATCTTETDSVQFALAEVCESSRACLTTTYRGQYFTLSTSTTLTGVGLVCNRDVTPTGNTTIYLYAYDTTYDTPTGSALASCTVANSSLSTSGTETFFEFSSAYSASAGTYCIYAVTEDAFMLSRTNTNPITNSVSIISTDSGSSWSEEASYDYMGTGIYGCLN